MSLIIISLSTQATNLLVSFDGLIIDLSQFDSVKRETRLCSSPSSLWPLPNPHPSPPLEA